MNEARAAVDNFEELYRGYRADVFRAALRELGNVHDAEDVTQAAFVDAYRAVLRGSEPHAPRAWLLTIAENVRRRRFRTAQRRPREEPLDEDFALAADGAHELASELEEALGALPPEQRRAFVLRELAGLSYEEIAAESDSTVGAIQMLLFRARRSLRERLEPPTVGRRVIFPLPGWLAGLVSRAEVAVMTPRAVGAVGATVAAVVASVAVNDMQAEAPAQAAVEPPPAVETSMPVAGGLVSAGAAGGSATQTPSRGAVARVFVTPAAAKPRRAGAESPAAAPSASAPVEEAPAAAEPTAAAPATPPVTSAVTPPVTGVATSAAPSRGVEPLEEVVAPVEEVVAPVEEVVEDVGEDVIEPVVSVVPAVPALPAPPPVPPLPTEPLEEVVAGAVGAAGVGIPPLPAPVVPPGTLPPAP